MRGLLAALLLTLLAGCSLGQPIARQAVDYNHAVETAANELLLANILRARDEKPLHFTSIPQIRGSLSLGLNQPGIGIPVAGSQQGFNLGLSGLNSPSFDVSTLDTQDFIRGILEPLESGIVRYYWDRGYPDHMLMILLFSSLEDPVTGRRLANDPRCWVDSQSCPVGYGSVGEVRAALIATLAMGRPIFHGYTAVIPLGAPLGAAAAGDAGLLALVAEGKLRLAPAPGGRFQLYRLEQRVSNCRRVPYRTANVLVPMGVTDPAMLARGNAQVCYADEVLEEPVAVSAGTIPRAQQVYVRSVQEIIRFLGLLVKVQQELRSRPGAPPCITINLPRDRSACLFQLLPGEGPPGAVTLRHDGARYHVPPFREPGEGGETVGDYSMRVLALLSDLVNLKKSSSSIPSTRAVQIVR